MPCASHTTAAEKHEAAAKAHHGAAELHEKGDHKALAKSTDAKCCCGSAQKATNDADEKSALQAKS